MFGDEEKRRFEEVEIYLLRIGGISGRRVLFHFSDAKISFATKSAVICTETIFLRKCVSKHHKSVYKEKRRHLHLWIFFTRTWKGCSTEFFERKAPSSANSYYYILLLYSYTTNKEKWKTQFVPGFSWEKRHHLHLVPCAEERHKCTGRNWCFREKRHHLHARKVHWSAQKAPSSATLLYLVKRSPCL